ncbi:MAG: sugar phosphate isomerase/epimerase [Eubacteriales bacterium]
MKISCTTDTFMRHFGDEEGLRKIAEAGFDCVDFGMFKYPMRGEIMTSDDASYERYFRSLAAVMEECGIYAGQVHSPMPSYTGNDSEDEYIFNIQARSILAASYLGSEYIVIHPCIPQEYRYEHFRAETKEINMRFFTRLTPYLEKYNVRLCVENMFNWDPEKSKICPTVCSSAWEMCDYIDTMNVSTSSDRFCACLDIGHGNLTGSKPQDMVRELGHRLATLHVHDNNGISDQHIAPYMGNVDWNAVCAALADIRYRGTFNFEADCYYDMFQCVLPESGKMLRAIGEQLVGKIIENEKNKGV